MMEKIRESSSKKIAAGALVFIAGISLVSIVVAYQSVEVSTQTESYPTDVQVNASEGQNISAGIDTGSGMGFGEMVEGTNVTKTLDLGSEQLTLVESSSEGNISENLVYDEQTLFEGQESLDYMHVGREPGYFNGTIILEIKTANNEMGERWLELQYQSPF